MPQMKLCIFQRSHASSGLASFRPVSWCILSSVATLLRQFRDGDLQRGTCQGLEKFLQIGFFFRL